VGEQRVGEPVAGRNRAPAPALRTRPLRAAFDPGDGAPIHNYGQYLFPTRRQVRWQGKRWLLRWCLLPAASGCASNANVCFEAGCFREAQKAVDGDLLKAPG